MKNIYSFLRKFSTSILKGLINLKLNANSLFILFALLGAVLSILIKIGLHSDTTFYSSFFTLMMLLMTFHWICYKAITQDLLKDLGDNKRMTEGSIVDSCYYLGFIFTLIILVTSFLSIGEDQNTLKLRYDSNFLALLDILNRFCVGLATTGYGLIARIHLSNLVEIEELDSEGLREKLNVKTAALINVIDNGVLSITNLINSSNNSIASSVENTTLAMSNSIANTTIAMSKAVENVTLTMAQQSNVLTENLIEISSNLSKITTKVKRQVTNLDLTDATTEIERHLNVTSSELANLNKSILGVSHNFNDTGALVEQSASKLNDVLDKLNDQHNELSKNVQSVILGFSSYVSETQKSEKILSATNSTITAFDGKLILTNRSVDNFTSSIDINNEKLSTLITKVGTTNNSINEFINATNSASSKIQSSVNLVDSQLNDKIKILESKVVELSSQFNELNSTLKIIDTSLKNKDENKSFFRR